MCYWQLFASNRLEHVLTDISQQAVNAYVA